MSLFNPDGLVGQLSAQGAVPTYTPYQAPVAAPVSSPQTSTLQTLLPHLDLSRVNDPGYMMQFANPSLGGGMGADGQYIGENGAMYTIKGTDGQLYDINSTGSSINLTSHYGEGDAGGGVYKEFSPSGQLLNSRNFQNYSGGMRDFIGMGAMMLAPIVGGAMLGAGAGAGAGGAEAVGPGMAGWGADLGTSMGTGLSAGELGAAAGGTGAMGAGSGAGFTFNAAADSQAANAAMGLSGSDAAAGASMWGLPSGNPVMSDPSLWEKLGSAGSKLFNGNGSGTGPGGGMDWQDALIKAGVNGLGGYLSSNAASGAAQTAASGAQFRPVGVTTRFGNSGFQFDANGNLIGAGYSLSPDAAALRDRMMAGTGADLAAADQASGAAQSLFGLGNKYISGDPAGDWMAAQQKLLAPSRQQQLAGVRANLFATGRSGLATNGTDTQAASNPELQAYYNSLANQDALLASQAQEQGRQSVSFGSGLFKNGMDLMNARYAPALSSAAGANTIEGYGQDALNMGAQLGGRSAQAGSNAAPWQYKANATSPMGAFMSGVGSSNIDYSGIYNGIKGLWSN